MMTWIDVKYNGKDRYSKMVKYNSMDRWRKILKNSGVLNAEGIEKVQSMDRFALKTFKRRKDVFFIRRV